MSVLRSDLKPALRSLRKAPVLTAVALVTLALSIGLNTAMFSVVDAVVLRPLPFANSARLIALCERERGERSDWCGSSVPNAYEVGSRSRTIAVMGVARAWPLALKTREGTTGLSGGLATAEAFRALEVEPLLGRLIEPEDVGRDFRRVVVLGHDLWRARFGGKPDVVGQVVDLDDEPYTVVGVLPPGVRIPLLENVQLWRPVHVDPRGESARGWRGFLAFGRLRDDATLAAARAEVETIAVGIQREHFAAKPGWSIGVRDWQDVVVGSVRRSMFVFAGAVGLVLLIGCANVANLLLAQATAREREVALHAALGASRWRLVRRLLVESAVLAIAGAGAGLLVGRWAAALVVALAPAGIPRLDQVRLDGAVLAFTVLVTGVVTLLVGIAPAIRATRVDPQRVLVEGGRAGAGRRVNRIGEILIVGEVALALVLVTGAGLLLRSFATLLEWEPGFEQRHLLTTWTFSSPGKFRTGHEVVDLIRRAEDALRTIPSVTAVASGSSGPLFGGDGEMSFTLDGKPAPAGGPRQATRWSDVSPRYFETIGLPIVNGRGLEETDGLDRPLVGVVNEAFVRRYFTSDPIGHVVHMEGHRADFIIVGVVRDVPAVRPGDPVPPQIFWPNRQAPRTANYYLVRVAGDPHGAAAAIRARLAAVDPEMQVSPVQTVRDWLGVELVRPRFAAILLGTFGAMALVLAAVGVYGLFAYTVARRTREIGIRVALGAAPGGLVRAVVLRAMRLATIAVVIGLAASIGLNRLLGGLLVGVGATDPLTLGGSIAVLLLAALVASAIPARRAARVNPLTALRAE